MKASHLKKEKNKMSVIKQLRNRLDITQEQMARELEMSVWSIGKWESGKHNPTFNFKQMKSLYVLLAKAHLSILDLPDNNFEDLPNRNK